MSTRSSLRICALLLTAAAMAWVVRSKPAAATAATNAPGEDLSALRAEVDSLKDSLQAVRAQAATRVTQPLTAADAKAPSNAAAPVAPAPPPSMEEMQQRQREYSQRVARSADHVLERETPDRAWSESHVQQINESVGKLSIKGFKLLGAQCGSTLCRTELESTDDADLVALGPTLHKLPPFNAMGSFYDYEEGRVVIYSPREGYDFPAIEPAAD